MSMLAVGFPDPVSWGWDKLGGWVSDQAAEGIQAVLAGISVWILDGAIQFSGAVYKQIVTASEVDLYGVAADGYQWAWGLATVLVVGAIWLSIGAAVINNNPGLAARRFLLDAPKFVLICATLFALTSASVSAVEEINTSLAASGGGQDAETIFESFRALGDRSAESGALASVLVPSVSLYMILVSMFLYIFLMLRTAAIYLLVVIAPLAAISVVTPYQQAFRKLLETLFALLISKTVILITLAVAGAALINLTEPLDDAALAALSPPADVPAELQAGADNDEAVDAETAAEAAAAAKVLGTMTIGTVLMTLAAFSPWLVFQLIPNLEGGAGVAQIARGGVTQDMRGSPGFAGAGRMRQHRRMNRAYRR